MNKLTSLTLAACSLLSPVVCPAQDAGPPLRIVVLPSLGDGARASLSKAAALRLSRALTGAGQSVLDADQAAEIAARTKDRLRAAFVGDDEPADVRLTRDALGDVLVRVGVVARRERKAQGRYHVVDRIDARLLMADDPVIGLDVGIEGKATSFDGFDDAHDRVLGDLLAPDAALIRRVLERLAALQRDEQEKGARYSIGLLLGDIDAAVADRIAGALAETEGVVAGSVERRDSGAVLIGDDAAKSVDYTLRFRGRPAELRRALSAAVEAHAEAESESDRDVYPVIVTSGRRLEVLVRSRPRGEPPEDAIGAMVEDAVRRIHARNRDMFADGQSLTVLPPEVVARDDVRRARDELAAAVRGADTDAGPVSAAGREFASATEAREELRKADSRHRETAAGKLAESLARRVAATVQQLAASGVTVDEPDAAAATAAIERTPELHRETGAVDTETLRAVAPERAGLAITTSLKKLLGKAELALSVIDLHTGQAIREFVGISDDLARKIEKRIGGL